MKKDRIRTLGLALVSALTFVGPIASVAVGTAIVTTSSPAEARSCAANSYVNSRGRCVHRPVRSKTVPRGASAQCRDGTYSFSQSRRGTCSYHGGVARWL